METRCEAAASWQWQLPVCVAWLLVAAGLCEGLEAVGVTVHIGGQASPRGIAPSLSACGEILSALLRDERVRALTVTEFNPHHGSQDGATTQRLLRILIKVLGKAE